MSTIANSSTTFASITTGDINFSNIAESETDTTNINFNGASSTSPFSGEGQPTQFAAVTSSGIDFGFGWSGYEVGSFSSDGSGASQTITITYTVAAGLGEGISSFESLYQIDTLSGDGTFTAVQSVYANANDTGLLGSSTFTSGSSASSSGQPAPVTLSTATPQVYVVLTLTDSALSAGSAIGVSILQQLYGEAPITTTGTTGAGTPGLTLDKQISADGTNWVDVGNGVGITTANTSADPNVLDGSPIFERVIIVNTGTAAITGASVTDVGGNGPAGFTFGGQSTTTIAGLGTVTSDVATISAAQGYELDTATATGNSVDNNGTAVTLTGTDQANYTGLPVGVALDKQISTDGVTWTDVGNGNLVLDPSVFVGSSIFERVIVTNTGSVALNSLTVSDVGGNGPASFAVGTSLGVGASETSTIATISAGSGYELDTATVTGTGSDNYNHTATVTASDQANYTGVAPAIALDKQISTDGSTWTDVGNGNLVLDPSVFVGSSVYERVIVSNTGSVALTGITVSDVGGNGPAGFAVGSSLAVGASETSTVATITAGSGYELDTATANGTGTDSVGHTQTVTATDQANYTGVAPAIALDKQISTDGSTWTDVGNGNLVLDPSVFTGTSIYERVIVSNTGSVALTSITVSDVGGNGPASFAVGSSLAVGASETSTVATITAASGYELDTATAKGTGTDSVGHTQTVTATDQANYTGVAPGIGLDKQISTDGTTWTDVGNGNLVLDPSVFTGSSVYERVIVSNTGSVALTSITVSDVGGNGPASFAVGSSLAVGASETSTVATITAASGYELDTATAKGTGTDSVGHTQTVTATDQANYTGVAPGIGLDKQISTDGTTWTDVGSGNLVLDPSVFTGTSIYERVIVSNTGTVALTSITVSDVGGNGPASFAVGSSLAVGASETSTVATITAGSGYELDTATAKGTGTDTVGHTQTVTATDQANYTGVAPAVALDKQISTDGTTWVDVGNGNLAQDPSVTVGSKVYERVIVTNTGSVALTSLSVSDIGGNGPASFSVGTSLAVGASETSVVGTISAGSGYELDTATVTGTGTDSVGHTQTVTASDQANYTGTTPTTTGITVNKIPCSMVINACGQETYTFVVTNTGSAPVTNITIKDNIGTAANPDYITPTLATTGFKGTLAPGASVDYTVTTNPIDGSSACNGTVSHTCSGSNLGSGNTAWFSCSFTPTSTKDGTCYVFKGVQCDLSGGGTGSKGYSVDCPDAVVTFSSSCKQATTTYNSSTNCWTTTLPANCNPGDVFLTGCPVTVPSGCSFSNATANWSIADSGNNCGSSSVSWNASCAGYSSFNQGGLNGCTDYNSIGVKVCDNSSGYGNGGCTDNGNGYCDGSYSNGGYSGWGGSSYNNNWLGSDNDCAGTPENQYTSTSCGSSGNNNGYGGNGYGGYGGCGQSGGYGNNGCGGGTNDGGCGNGGSGTCTQTQVGATGVADTVTVTGISNGTTVTASDTAEIVVLGSPNNVTVGGTATTSSLSAAYGKAQTLEFSYNPSTTVSTKTVSIGAATGSAPGSMAFIAITNNSNPKASGAQVYFEGTVSTGQEIYADASINSLTNTANTGSAAFMSTVAGQGIFADIYASQAAFLAGAAPIQVDTYNTSGSQSMHLGDQIGSLKVVGYVGSTGGHLVT